MLADCAGGDCRLLRVSAEPCWAEDERLHLRVGAGARQPARRCLAGLQVGCSAAFGRVSFQRPLSCESLFAAL